MMFSFPKQIEWEIHLSSRGEWSSPVFFFLGMEYKLVVCKIPAEFQMLVFVQGPDFANPARAVKWRMGVRTEGEGIRRWIKAGQFSVGRSGLRLVEEWTSPESDFGTGRESPVQHPRVTLELVEEPFEITRLSKGQTVMKERVNNLRAYRKYFDVTIRVKNSTFRAHREILGIYSPVLGAMFHSDVENLTISLDNCEPGVFQILLLYIYSGCVENLTSENVQDTYCAADKYEIADVRRVCSLFMIFTLSENNIFGVVRISKEHGDTELYNGAISYFVDNAERIFPSDCWHRFMRDCFTEAHELFSTVIRVLAGGEIPDPPLPNQRGICDDTDRGLPTRTERMLYVQEHAQSEVQHG